MRTLTGVHKKISALPNLFSGTWIDRSDSGTDQSELVEFFAQPRMKHDLTPGVTYPFITLVAGQRNGIDRSIKEIY